MIYGTPYAPGKAFIEFAGEFFAALASGNYQAVLGKLDVTDRKWSKNKLQSELHQAMGDATVCSSVDILRSAEPELIELGNGNYQLIHRIPVDGRRSTAKARFEFVAKHHGSQFSVRLLGFEPQ